MEVIGTKGVGGWYDGQYESRRGYVTNFSEGGTNFDALAKIEWLDSGIASLTVPARFLQPVQPENRSDSAVVLTGRHLGREVRIRETDGSNWTVSDAQMEVFECAVSKMVKLHV